MVVEDLYSAMQGVGFEPPERFTPGQITRFSRNGRKSDRAGWLLAFPDGQGAVFGDWRTGEEHQWQAKRDTPLSPSERAAFDAMVRETKRKANEAKEADYREAAARASELWSHGKDASGHGYLTKKGVNPCGVLVAPDGRLMIPLYGPDGLQSLQFIRADGEKRFLTGGKKKGGHVWLGNPNGSSKGYLCEGWATGATIHQATRAPVCVAFDAGNLLEVARFIQQNHRTMKIVVAGDDDRQTEGNPGRIKAIEAADSIGAESVFPVFPEGATGSDFNDLAALKGIDAVLAALGEVKPHGINLGDWHAKERFSGSVPVRQWLVSGVFPAGKPALVAAGGGIGKSYLLLDLARAVAKGAMHCSMGVLERTGAAVMLCAEDDAIEIHSRLAALGDTPARLFVIPCPDAGGVPSLFGLDARGKEPVTTPQFQSLASQFREIIDLALICLDPLQALCGGLDLNLPQHAQFVCSSLAQLASETGAAVLVSHHFRKSGPISSPEGARDAIRGTGGLVDGVRCVYALWPSGEEECKRVCRVLGLVPDRGMVVHGAVVKANGRADMSVATFVRDKNGMLQDRRFELGTLTPPRDSLILRLKDGIAEAAARGMPFTKTYTSGIYARRHELIGFQDMGKHSLEGMVQELLVGGGLIQCRMKPSEAPPGKWLDVPGGVVATISAEINRAVVEKAEAAPHE